MPADIKPSTWFGPGYTFDGASHTARFTTNNASSNKVLQQLLDAASDPTTGDARQIAFALVEAMYQAFKARIVANDRPVEISISKAASSDASGNLTFIYQCNFTVSAAGLLFDVPDEPPA